MVWSCWSDRAINAIRVRSGGIMETGQVVGRGYFEHKRCPFGGVYCPLRRTVNKTAEKGSDKKEGCWRLRANLCGFMGWFDINFCVVHSFVSEK